MEYQIFLVVSGNGTAEVIPTSQEGGQPVTLYCLPYSGETLDDIEAQDPEGHSVALEVSEEQTFNMPAFNLTIYVTFSGTIPPEPPTTKRKKMPLWMMLRRRNLYL